MLFLAPLIIPIEIVSHFARPLSLTIRLYANMVAGEQVYLTFITLTKLIIPVIFIGLHLFVGFLQAYIFMLLAMVYVGGAVSHEHYALSASSVSARRPNARCRTTSWKQLT